jgi:hypothetical protein
MDRRLVLTQKVQPRRRPWFEWIVKVAKEAEGVVLQDSALAQPTQDVLPAEGRLLSLRKPEPIPQSEIQV